MQRTFSLSRDAGFSLIEVLVAVLVLAIGMLGIAAMQAIALRNSQSAMQRSQATFSIYSILDAMRVNRNDVIISRYNLTTYTCVPPDPDTRARADLNQWMLSLQQSVHPAACARVVCDNEAVCQIDVRWDDSRGSGNEVALQQHVVSTRSRL